MSYGYQGPPVQPFPGQKPPNSFGVPPGMPSAPGISPYPANSGIGFNLPPAAPASFGMPQPYSPYSHAPYPSNQQNPSMMSYAPQGGGYGQPISQPQQYNYETRQNVSAQPPPGSYSQARHSEAYPNPNPNIQTTQNPHQQSLDHRSTPYMGDSPHSPHSSHSSSYQTQSSSYPRTSNPYPQSSNPYSAACYPGGQGMGAPQQYSQQFNTSNSASSSPRRFVPAPRQTRPINKLSPTVVPYRDFDARADAEALRKAMKGWGTDEKTIINVLVNRNNTQRQEIAVQFKTLYGKELIKDLKSELTGNFESLIVAMMTPLPQYYAKELHNAMAGIGTEETVLIEVLCTMSNHEIRVIKQAYQSMYGRTLENDLKGDTSGSFKRLMVSLCCANRDESFDVDPSAAQEDARALLRAGELRFGTDESVFNQILVQRNVAQLQRIFMEYEGMTGHSIEQAIENEFSGDIKKGLLAIIKCVKSRAAFFAEQLYKSMKGLGTQDNRLIRLVVTRCEIDMEEIKQVFVQQYNESLADFISGDCSGDYKKCLLALIDA